MYAVGLTAGVAILHTYCHILNQNVPSNRYYCVPMEPCECLKKANSLAFLSKNSFFFFFWKG